MSRSTSTILLFGAGRSCSVLLDYLKSGAKQQNWEVIVADEKRPVSANPPLKFRKVNITDKKKRMKLIRESSIVISMLPPGLHYLVAADCVKLKRDLVTASYAKSFIKANNDIDDPGQTSEKLRDLDAQAKKAGILLMSEMGLDPGIDHMSAKQIIDQIRAEGGKLTSFKSFAGGLVAPESDDNPWGYKFTWNPRNVIQAGKGTAQYIKKGRYKYIPYHKIFRRIETIKIKGYGAFEGYANRDSLSYREAYNIKDIPTIFRGTLRRPGFCAAWDVFVQLGLTDNSYQLENGSKMSYRDFLNTFMVYNPREPVEKKLAKYLGIGEKSKIMKQLKWVGIFDKKAIGLKNPSPAQVLLSLLEKKWVLRPNDKDMIIMQHQFEYILKGKKLTRVSSMVVKGDDRVRTAMAKTVGLPIGIITKLILNGKIKQKGIHIPVSPSIYKPVLKELEEYGIRFFEE